MTAKPLKWPPIVGRRVHRDTGCAHSSWSGEVRAIVDDKVAIIRRWRQRLRYHQYDIVDRFEVEEFKTLFYGPLPKARRP